MNSTQGNELVVFGALVEDREPRRRCHIGHTYMYIHTYRKNPKNLDTQKIAEITLKIEQSGFTIKKYVQIIQPE